MGDDLMTTSGVLAKDTMVSHYRIVAKIGSGGMGEVYLADDTKLNRRVALKFLPSHLAADTILRARFTREVQAVAALNHPNIIHVYEVSEFNRRPFFAMEYVEGESLRERMREGKLPITAALQYIIGLCEGLEAAHQVGIVHRDIKPANIVIANSGRIKILDFGLAKRASDPTLTSMGSTLGTICYMSPEQVQGRDSDNRSDLFSVGIVLYELIAGRLPFRGDYDAATLTSIVSDPHEPLTKYRPDVPPRLSAIVDRLLAKDPAQRYQSVTDLLKDLHETHDAVKFSSRFPQETAGLKSRRMALVAGLGGLVVLSVAAALLLSKNDAGTDVAEQTRTQRGTASVPSQSIGDEKAKPAQADGSAEQPDAQPHSPVVDRSAFIAESIATAAESARLRALRDSLETERKRLLTQPQTFAAADTVTSSTPVRNEPATVAVAERTPAAPAAQPSSTHNRTADSAAIHALLGQFWETLETGRVGELKKSYPKMPRDWEAMWGTFVDYAKDLRVTSSIARLRFNDDGAEATNRVQMTFRDRGGLKNQDVNYSARLIRRDSRWFIDTLERHP